MTAQHLEPELAYRLLNMQTNDPVMSAEEIVSNAQDVLIFSDPDTNKQFAVCTLEIRRGSLGNSLFVTGAASLPGRMATKECFRSVEYKAKSQGFSHIECVCCLPAQIRQLTALGFKIHSYNLSKKV